MIERWTWKRKAAILDALDAGTTTAGELATMYGITSEELATWQRDRAAGGAKALRATSLQYYRRLRRLRPEDPDA